MPDLSFLPEIFVSNADLTVDFAELEVARLSSTEPTRLRTQMKPML
jgi:hypothetical protein